MKRTFVLQPSTHPARQNCIQHVQNAPDGFVVSVGEPTRNLLQNAAQWPILEAFSRQLEWPINGVMSKLEAEEWKEILSAAFFKENVRLAPGLDGGMVMLGKRTSKFSKREFSEWLEFLNATAAIRGVEIERATQ